MKTEIDVKCFFCINRDNHENISTFEVTDASTSKRIINITFTATQLSQLLGRMGNVDGKATIIDVENFKSVGKNRITEVFPVIVTGDYYTREKEAITKAKELLKDNEFDWEISSYFGSKDSFTTINGEVYANVKITRYE